MQTPTTSVVPLRFALVGLALLCSVLATGEVRAQAPDSTRIKTPFATRAQLDSTAAQLERDAQAAQGDNGTRMRAEASAIRARLTDGDFNPGDRIILNVQGDSVLSDTFTVRAGQVINLPNIGDIPLHGVLRSELEPHLTEQIGRFVKAPVVTASSLLRIAVLGEVGKPGFYATSPDILMSDAVMLAGGPNQAADLGRTVVKRGSETLWKQKDVQNAFTAGFTLEQMNLRAGDEIIVGTKEKKNWLQYAQTGAVLLGIGLSLWGTSRLRR